MNWISPSLTPDSSARPVDRIGFDMIRAIVGARQSACATVKALHANAVVAEREEGDRHDSTIALLAGRRIENVNGGAFARVDSPDRSCPGRDERHG